MNINLDKIAKDLYGKIQTRFPDIKIGDENAATLSRKEDIPKARFFEFEYTEGGESLGTIAITLDEDDGIVVQVSGDLVNDNDGTTHHGAYKFIRSFRQFARDRLLKFDVDNIGKSNLDKRDYMFQAKRKEEPTMPAIMENKLYGSNKISYQDLGEAKLIIKHTQAINPLLPAGRTMHIESIYIENAQGERFRYPFKHLSGARALAEHIKHGGNPYDGIGKHIRGLSEELAGLRKFKGYVMRQEQISEAMGGVTSKVMERIDSIKKELAGLQRATYYEQFAESFEEQEEIVIPEEIQNDLIDRLTIRTFNEELKSVFPYIAKFVKENELPVRELGSDELLGEDEQCDVCDHTPCICDTEKKKDESFDPELAYESFMNDIIREDKDELFSPNKAAKLRAINKLNQILSHELPGGPNGINAIESLKGLIDDPDFIEDIKELDPNLDIRPVLQQWLHNNLDKFPGNAAETMAMIHFGGDENSIDKMSPEDEAPPEAAAPAPEAPPAAPPGPEAAAPAPAAPPGPEAAAMPPGPEAAPAAPPAPMAESSSLSKLKAKFIKVKESGATLDTVLEFGHRAITVREAIEECGMNPSECGYEEEAMYDDDEPQEGGLQSMLRYISGFYNKEHGNFTIGGTRTKIKLKKAWEDGEFGDVGQDELIKVFKLIDQKDPSHEGHDEQHDVLRLAGVSQPHDADVEETWDIDNLENNVKGIKLQFGDDEIDLMNPDENQMKRIGSGIMQGVQQKMPSQTVQFPGGQMNPSDMMKALIQKINFGN